MTDIQALQKAILDLHGCVAVHVGSEAVRETFHGETVWQGVVEVFEITGHPKAKRCYAWSHAESGSKLGRRYVAVLELPPVFSPVEAVRAAVVQEKKAREG